MFVWACERLNGSFVLLGLGGKRECGEGEKWWREGGGWVVWVGEREWGEERERGEGIDR